MAVKIFNSDVEIENAPFFNVENFKDHLVSNNFVYVSNAIDVNNIYLNEAINEFKQDDNPLNRLKESYKHQKSFHFDKHLQLYSFLKNSPVVNGLKALLSNPIISNHAWIRYSKKTLGTYPHADRFFISPKSFFYSVWIALYDLKIQNGVLCAVKPGRSNEVVATYLERIKESYKVANQTTSWQEARLDITPDKISPVWIANDMKKGDAIIFRDDLVHGTVNGNEGERLSIDFRVTDGNLDFDTRWFIR